MGTGSDQRIEQHSRLIRVDGFAFNPPPGWPTPPDGWVPPPDWTADPAWPPAPPDWEWWVPTGGAPPGAPVAMSADSLRPETRETDAETSVTPEAVQVEGPAEVSRLRAEVARLSKELEGRSAPVPDSLVDLDDERILQEVGIYRYHHPLENAAAYQERLRAIQQGIAAMVKAGGAILASDMFTYNNSLAKGRRMTADLSKLMLRAYNAEADTCVRTVRAGNVVTAKQRLGRSVEAIAKLGTMMEMRVSPEYHDLRIQEVELTADYLMKLQEERDAAREERERLREEQRVERELAAQRQELAKERAHYENALGALRSAGDPSAIAEMEERLALVDARIEENDYRSANIRAGYVYVISNPGAFGHHMVKIGMTRRLEPLDRVRELGDASVPFPFDVHALFFADDAIDVEGKLHKAFEHARVNRVNERREFFFASPADVKAALDQHVGAVLEFTEEAEGTQYHQSKKYWSEESRAGGAAS